MPGMADYNLYAASLAAAGISPNMNFGLGSVGGGGAQFMQLQQQNQHQQQQQQNSQNISPGSSATMQFPSSNQTFLPPGSFPQLQQQQQQTSNPHQRTMSAVAGLGQSIGGGQQSLPQHYGGQNPSGMVGSNSAPNTTQTGAAPSPQYGMVGPAGFQPGSPNSQNNSPFINNALNPNNATSPSAQAMSAMSSMSGIPSSNTSASANTPISPATAYTPNFASPSLSQQAAFNAAAAAGLGVNFSAFGFPNSECLQSLVALSM